MRVLKEVGLWLLVSGTLLGLWLGWDAAAGLLIAGAVSLVASAIWHRAAGALPPSRYPEHQEQDARDRTRLIVNVIAVAALPFVLFAAAEGAYLPGAIVFAMVCVGILVAMRLTRAATRPHRRTRSR